ncbi:ATP-dependent helicase HrpB [Aliidiomarina taiwanensis]|uniref:ATP-dependent helicase HrpB n=1 Tax=Aliidiomarina taiwanensis TaxID=946228 RepID=UPI001300AFC3|nr:ATP-dependent helicase HrpB [Aliidiomarina taiwanensis]
MSEPSPLCSTHKLPVEGILDEVAGALATHHVVLEAAPGAGKSTALPRWLLQQYHGWNGRIILIQPRRVAAVNVAHYVAAQLGEKPGQRVGFHIRNQKCLSASTQLLVVTEGIFTRMLQRDPELQGVGLVIFDEFHERNLHSDLGLALCLDVLPLRADLRVMVMSATLPGQMIQTWLEEQGHATHFVASEGRQYPITTHYRPPSTLENWLQDLPAVVREALTMAQKGVLVFVPGQREIRRLQEAFRTAPAQVRVMALYGGLTIEEQQAVMAPLARGLKLVFATNVAETSLTIPDIDVVVDSGRERRAQYSPKYGFTRLSTRMISRASAVQRAGRAGRTGPGHCFRLWQEGGTDRLDAFGTPAIEREDLANLLLELKVWGAPVEQLAWYTPPSPALLAAAEQQLHDLQAIEKGQVTARGAELVKASTELRYAAILAYSRKQSVREQVLAAWLVANLEEREGRFTGHLQTALHQRWQQTNGLPRTQRRFQHWLRFLGCQPVPELPFSELPRMLLEGFADRVAEPQRGRYQLATGLALEMGEERPPSGDWLIAVEVSLQQDQAAARLWLYESFNPEILAAMSHPLKLSATRARWRGEQGGLEREHVVSWGKLILQTTQAKGAITADERGKALADWLRQQGWGKTAWSHAEDQFCARMQQLMRLNQASAEGWTAHALLEQLEQWALPWLITMERRNDLKQWRPLEALRTLITQQQRQQLERWLPTEWQAPSGRRHSINYTATDAPFIALKLQEVFGTPSSPTLANGQLTLAFELLSPAGRLLHRTADLASFWQNAWPEVRKEMRGRYPKHPWPEHPVEAEATHLTKRALARKKP